MDGPSTQGSLKGGDSVATVLGSSLSEWPHPSPPPPAAPRGNADLPLQEAKSAIHFPSSVASWASSPFTFHFIHSALQPEVYKVASQRVLRAQPAVSQLLGLFHCFILIGSFFPPQGLPHFCKITPSTTDPLHMVFTCFQRLPPTLLSSPPFCLGSPEPS